MPTRKDLFPFVLRALRYDLIRPHKTHKAAVSDIVDAVRDGLEKAHFLEGWPD